MKLRQAVSEEHQVCRALGLYLLYLILFLSLCTVRIRMIWWGDKKPMCNNIRTLGYLTTFCLEGFVVSTARLIEARCSSTVAHEPTASSSFLRFGLSALNFRCHDDVEALSRSLQSYLLYECQAEAAIPDAALEVLAEGACDEEKDFGRLVEPWKFRLLRRAWGMAHFFSVHRERLREQFTGSFHLRRTGGASAAFFVKCEEEQVIIKVEEGTSIAEQVKS
mmetsp:Transcript_116839/g.363787  ORF Transcript_116839/g.363787 Transcript_116839/m.363787 type:complete len:221 (+) Transcript_116839:500-1162(+)